jgi:predicted dehydrogenase
MAQETTMKLHICVIGAGALGQVHARNWPQVPDAQVVAVADPWVERAKALAEEMGCPWFADYHEALKVEGLSAVSVAVPSAYHRECTVAALEAGCHVICEKPIALSLEDAREMIRVAGERGLKLALGFCKRFMGQVQTVREIIQTGQLGRPVMYRHASAIEIRPKPWIMDRNLGGGPIFDISCHYTDQWRVIFGSNPARVKASGLTIMNDSPDKPDIDPQVDTFAMTVEYGSGDIGVLSMTWGLPHGVTGQTLEDCIGPLGLLKIEGAKVEQLGPAKRQEVFEGLSTDIHPAQLNAFADAIRLDQPVAASGEDGLWALQTSLAALQSIETGEAVAVRGPWE